MNRSEEKKIMLFAEKLLRAYSSNTSSDVVNRELRAYEACYQVIKKRHHTQTNDDGNDDDDGGQVERK